MYLVLGILYESYIHPLTILSTLPSAGVGALLALELFDTPFSLIALIGIMLLIGIVKKNAIIMVDFAIQAQRTGGLIMSQLLTLFTTPVVYLSFDSLRQYWQRKRTIPTAVSGE